MGSAQQAAEQPGSAHVLEAQDLEQARVLSVNDLNFDHKGNHIFLAYQQAKERLAALTGPVTLGALGVSGIPS